MNSKQKKKFLQSTYPNVPSSLVQVLHKVVYHMNVGRRRNCKEEEEPPVVTVEEVAYQTTRTANNFFQLGLDIYNKQQQDS